MIPPFPPADSDLARVIRSRRTINDFETAPVPLATILQGIELARWAPNHKLTEPWRFHILGPETVHAIVLLNTRLIEEVQGSETARKKYARWSSMPGWLAVSCLRSPDPLRDEENYAAVCCAIQNLSLFLWSRNVGLKWTTGDVIRHPEFYEILNLDAREQRIVGLFWYGLPAKCPEMHRRDVSEITTILP